MDSMNLLSKCLASILCRMFAICAPSLQLSASVNSMEKQDDSHFSMAGVRGVAEGAEVEVMVKSSTCFVSGVFFNLFNKKGKAERKKNIIFLERIKRSNVYQKKFSLRQFIFNSFNL